MGEKLAALIDVLHTNSTQVVTIENNTTTAENNCSRPDDEIDWVRVKAAYIGSVVSVAGVVFTLLILRVYCCRSEKTSYSLVLQALAVFDLGVLVSYPFIGGLEAIAMSQHSMTAYIVYIHTIRLFFPLGKICKMASTYTVLVASLKNFSALVRPETMKCLNKSLSIRYILYWILGVAVLSTVSHISRSFEIKIKVKPQCPPSSFSRYDIGSSDLLSDPFYHHWYSLVYTLAFNLVLPSACLLILTVLNLMMYHIAYHGDDDSEPEINGMHDSHRQSKLSMTDTQPSSLKRRHTYRKLYTRIHRQKYKECAKVMLVLLLTSLAMHSISLALTITEAVDIKFLRQNQYIYSVAVETINILTVAVSSFRILNYWIFNHEFRKELISNLTGRKTNDQTDQKTANNNEVQVMLIPSFSATLECSDDPTNHQQAERRVMFQPSDDCT